MKDLVIPARVVARELRIAAACVLVALAMNIYAIVRFKTAWSELATTLPITLAVAAVIYLVFAVARLLVALVRRLIRRRA